MAWIDNANLNRIHWSGNKIYPLNQWCDGVRHRFYMNPIYIAMAGASLGAFRHGNEIFNLTAANYNHGVPIPSWLYDHNYGGPPEYFTIDDANSLHPGNTWRQSLEVDWYQGSWEVTYGYENDGDGKTYTYSGSIIRKRSFISDNQNQYNSFTIGRQPYSADGRLWNVNGNVNGRDIQSYPNYGYDMPFYGFRIRTNLCVNHIHLTGPSDFHLSPFYFSDRSGEEWCTANLIQGDWNKVYIRVSGSHHYMLRYSHGSAADGRYSWLQVSGSNNLIYIKFDPGAYLQLGYQNGAARNNICSVIRTPIGNNNTIVFENVSIDGHISNGSGRIAFSGPITSNPIIHVV